MASIPRIHLPRFNGAKSDPTQKVSGTSLVSKGHTALPSADMMERGSSMDIRIPDQVPALQSTAQQIRTYTQMYRTDVSVRVSLRCAEGPVLGGDYTIEPFDDTEQSAVIAAFVDYNLFHSAAPWLSQCAQILKMFRAGAQVFEPCWGLREWAPSKVIKGANRKVYTVLDKMAVRPIGTLGNFQYDDNGDLLSIDQNATRAGGKSEVVTLNADKLLVFTFDKDGGNILGESILRPAYPHWYYKGKLYAIDAIQKERHGMGVPDVELQMGFSPNDKKAANAMAKNLRTNEYAYIVRNQMLKVGFAELKGQPVNPLESAIHHDNMIMKNILTQFLQIDGVSGGRASSATSMDMMMKSMRYIANFICDQFNYYIIPALVGYNFDTDQAPKMVVRNVGEAKDLQMWAAAMSNLVNCEAIEVDDDTENWLRKVIDMPKRTTPRSQLGPHDVKQQTLLQGEVPGSNATSTKPINSGTGSGPARGAGSTKQVQTGNVGKSPSSGA